MDDDLDETTRQRRLRLDGAGLMVLFLALAVLVWLAGGRLGYARQLRLTAIALLYVLFAAVAVLVPETAGIRRVIGGSSGEWLAVGGLAGPAAAYAAGLGWIRARVRPRTARRARTATPDDRLGRSRSTAMPAASSCARSAAPASAG